MEKVFDEMKRTITLFLDIVYKIKNNDLKINNVVLTRHFEDVTKDFREQYSQKVIAENEVGLTFKTIDKRNDCILAHSYFVLDKRVDKFIDNFQEEIDNLYNIWI